MPSRLLSFRHMVNMPMMYAQVFPWQRPNQQTAASAVGQHAGMGAAAAARKRTRAGTGADQPAPRPAPGAFTEFTHLLAAGRSRA